MYTFQRNTFRHCKLGILATYTLIGLSTHAKSRYLVWLHMKCYGYIVLSYVTYNSLQSRGVQLHFTFLPSAKIAELWTLTPRLLQCSKD